MMKKFLPINQMNITRPAAVMNTLDIYADERYFSGNEFYLTDNIGIFSQKSTKKILLC